MIKTDGNPTIAWSDVPLAEVEIEPDIRVEGLGGSVVILRGITLPGIDWLDDNVDIPNWARIAPNGVACEPRYLDTIVEGAQNDGLKVA